MSTGRNRLDSRGIDHCLCCDAQVLLLLLFYSFGVLFTQLVLDDCRLKDIDAPIKFRDAVKQM